MFKKLRLWLIKKLKATPNEFFETKWNIQKTEVPIKKVVFERCFSKEDLICFNQDENYLKQKVEDEFYKELKNSKLFSIKSQIDNDMIIYYAVIGFAELEK